MAAFAVDVAGALGSHRAGAAVSSPEQHGDASLAVFGRRFQVGLVTPCGQVTVWSSQLIRKSSLAKPGRSRARWSTRTEPIMVT